MIKYDSHVGLYDAPTRDDMLPPMSPKSSKTPNSRFFSKYTPAKSNILSTIDTSASKARLYKKMEAQTMIAEEVSLKEKKKRLEEIRSLHKPLEKKELAEHAYNYQKTKIERETSIKNKRK